MGGGGGGSLHFALVNVESESQAACVRACQSSPPMLPALEAGDELCLKLSCVSELQTKLTEEKSD